MQQVFNFEEAKKKRDKAMSRADSHANAEWQTYVDSLIQDLARTKESFTSDDLLMLLEADRDAPKTHDNRAIGPRFKKAEKDKLIINSGMFARSLRRHLSPITIWQSLIFEK